ncbi:MAG TPA: archease [Candidatus Nanoarchaeia archaeon]|nr:archease [Candidatus Nanoarchaeia archaeon]
MKSYKFIEHTADVLFEAKGNNLNELFEQCALALEDTQVDINLIKPIETLKITGKNKRIDLLLFDFLDDLLFYKDSKQLLFSQFDLDVREVNGQYQLTCQAYGEKLDLSKHDPKVDAKAITMHLFEVKKTAKGWQAKVLVDI